MALNANPKAEIPQAPAPAVDLVYVVSYFGRVEGVFRDLEFATSAIKNHKYQNSVKLECVPIS